MRKIAVVVLLVLASCHRTNAPSKQWETLADGSQFYQRSASANGIAQQTTIRCWNNGNHVDCIDVDMSLFKGNMNVHHATHWRANSMGEFERQVNDWKKTTRFKCQRSVNPDGLGEAIIDPDGKIIEMNMSEPDAGNFSEWPKDKAIALLKIHGGTGDEWLNCRNFFKIMDSPNPKIWSSEFVSANDVFQ